MTTNTFILISTLIFSISISDAQLLIESSRTIKFNTTEGSFMNIDLSPDEKTLVFDLLGDLYTMPATGGKCRQITKGMSINIRPSWSPDGKKIAFYSDRSGSWQLHIIDQTGSIQLIDGKERHPNIESNIHWFNDQHFIRIQGKIYDINSRQIVNSKDLTDTIGYDKDHKHFYYQKGLTVFKVNINDNTEIEEFSLINEEKKYFTAPPMNFRITPDNKKLLFVWDKEGIRSLMVYDFTSRKTSVLVSFLHYVDASENSFEGSTPLQYCFSRNSQFIFLGYGGKIHRIDIANGMNSVVPFEADVKVDVSKRSHFSFDINHNSFVPKYCRSASLSPDGKKVVFSALGKVFIKTLANGELTSIADQNANQFQPVWSNDNKWIAYVTWNDHQAGQLWRVSSTGGIPEQLSAYRGLYERPVWIPGDTAIAVIRCAPQLEKPFGEPVNGDLELVSISGRLIRTMAENVSTSDIPTFSSDGQRLIYHLATDELGKLLIKDTLVILPHGGLSEDDHAFERLAASQCQVSPDGRFLAGRFASDIYLADLKNEKKTIVRLATGIDPHWEEGGSVLAWTESNNLCRVNTEKILSLATQFGARKDSGMLIKYDITPDEVIQLTDSVPTLYGPGTIAFTNARIISMKGDEIIERGTVIIKNGRITSVGKSSKIVVPHNAKTFDITGKTIIPGFIDLHAHLRVSSNILPQQSWMLLANLAYGTTTARDPSSTIDEFGFAELIRAGKMIGPRLFSVGEAIRINTHRPITNFDDALHIVSGKMRYNAVTIKQYTLENRFQRQNLLRACDSLHMNMTNEGTSNGFNHLSMIKDGSSGIEHNPDFGDIHNDYKKLIAKSGITLTTAMQMSYGTSHSKWYLNKLFWKEPGDKLKNFYPQKALEDLEMSDWQRQRYLSDSSFIRSARADNDIIQMGGNIALGSHGENQGIGMQNELWALQMGGLSNHKALQVATINGARALGMEKHLGSIEVGKIADLIILNKNPLKDIHYSREIEYIMKDGIMYDGDTLDILWPYDQKCPNWQLN